MIHTADTITEKKDDLLMSYEKYSVLMPLYVKDDPDWFRVSVDSMLHQTVPPDEIFIICDGPLSKELDAALEDYTQAYPGLFTIHRIKENVGLGNALVKAVPLCRNELIARMTQSHWIQRYYSGLLRYSFKYLSSSFTFLRFTASASKGRYTRSSG